MSEYGGCLVCGVVLNKSDGLLCHDCVYDGYMKKTGSKAKYIKITHDGPLDITDWVQDLALDSKAYYELKGYNDAG